MGGEVRFERKNGDKDIHDRVAADAVLFTVFDAMK